MGDFIHAPQGVVGRSFHGDRARNHHGRASRGRGRGRGRGGRGRGGRERRGRGRDGGRPHNYDVSKDHIEILGEASNTSLNIAIEGCCHGELDLIYERLEAHEKQTGQKVDLLICCGDFQSHRNLADFHSSSIPPKYRRLGTFPKYYSGEKRAPILTLFIGGNHEASQPLRELYYGGWVAPNIYYMGAAGVVRYGGIRIGGISGIYKAHDYELGHFERPPFDNSTRRSVYHVRNADIYRMKCLSREESRVDIVVSHDWPIGIEQHGNTEALLRKKPFFRAEVERNDLGSPPNRQVLDTVQPRWWFAAHLHVKFIAKVQHQLSTDNTFKDTELSQARSAQLVPSQVKSNRGVSGVNTDPGATPQDALQATDGDNTDPPAQHGNGEDVTKKTEFRALESSCNAMPDLTDLMTKFLALDKCLPRRQYLSMLHVESGTSREDAHLEYDAEWLAILRNTDQLTCIQRRKVTIPEEPSHVTERDIQWVEDRLKSKNAKNSNDSASFREIPHDFQPTVPYYSDPCFRGPARCPPLPPMGNPQTDRLLELLDLDHTLTIPFDASLTVESISATLAGQNSGNVAQPPDANEIDINLEETSTEPPPVEAADENEIDLNGMDDAEDLGAGEGATATKSAVGSSEENTPTKKARLDD